VRSSMQNHACACMPYAFKAACLVPSWRASLLLGGSNSGMPTAARNAPTDAAANGKWDAYCRLQVWSIRPIITASSCSQIALEHAPLVVQTLAPGRASVSAMQLLPLPARDMDALLGGPPTPPGAGGGAVPAQQGSTDAYMLILQVTGLAWLAVDAPLPGCSAWRSERPLLWAPQLCWAHHSSVPAASSNPSCWAPAPLLCRAQQQRWKGQASSKAFANCDRPSAARRWWPP